MVSLVFMVITVIIVFIFSLILNYIMFKKIYEKEKNLLIERINNFLDKSYSVMKGQVGEQIVPFVEDFPYSPKDLVFLGRPVDYIVFDGLSNDNLRQIVFLEIKTGKSKLNEREKQIKKIIKQKKVFWDEYRLKK